MYDMCFAYVDGDTSRPSFGAGSAVLLAVKMALEYKGGIFWKMCAGMGDAVFAPLYQALRRRGVDFEFFHRVDALHLSADRTAIEAISVGRQAALAPGIERYEPPVRVRGLPCFPGAPLADQLADADGIEHEPLEAHGCAWPDAERRVLRRGTDFDVAVLAIPVGMADLVCRELIDDRPEWRDMVANVATVATQAFQIWLREPEPALGWPHPGATMSGYTDPFDTWASMPQLIDAEDWPDDDRPAAIAYFCGMMPAPRRSVTDASDGDGYHEQVRERAVAFLDRNLGHLLPGAVDHDGFKWDLLCGRSGSTGPAAFDSQFWTATSEPERPAATQQERGAWSDPRARPMTPFQERLGRVAVRWMTGVNTAAYRLSNGRVAAHVPGGAPICLLTTTGRRSGRPRTVPLLYIPHDDG